MKKTYIQKACGQISAKAEREQVCAELEAHISDKTDYYLELGYEEADARQKALEDMGDPEEISAPLIALHKAKTFSCVILTVVLFLLCIAVHFYHERLDYGTQYEILVYHSIVMDFLSMAFIGTAAAVLIVSYRKKNKRFALIVASVLIITLILSLTGLNEYNSSPLYAFEPAAYSAAKIITSGFEGYLDSIFAYSSVQGGISGQYYRLFAVIIFALLMIWSISQFIILHRMERMKNARTASKVLRISGRAFSLLLAANTAVMIICAGTAAVSLPQRLEAAKAERAKLIEDVINADLDSAPSQSWRQNFQRIEGGKLPEDYYYSKLRSSFFIDIYGDESYCGNRSNSMMFYKKTEQRTLLGFWNRNISLPPSAERSIGKTQLSICYPNLPLSDFMEWNFHTAAAGAVHYRFKNTNGKTEEHIQFWYYIENKPELATFSKHSDGKFYFEKYILLFHDEYFNNDGGQNENQ